MSLITRMRKQTAVYWAQTQPDDYGKFAYEEPVEIGCRWDDDQREFIGKDGTRQMSRSVVYVDRAMKPGDYLRQGTLADLLDEVSGVPSTDPQEYTQSWEVQGVGTIPNLKATEFLRIAFL